MYVKQIAAARAWQPRQNNTELQGLDCHRTVLFPFRTGTTAKLRYTYYVRLFLVSLPSECFHSLYRGLVLHSKEMSHYEDINIINVIAITIAIIIIIMNIIIISSSTSTSSASTSSTSTSSSPSPSPSSSASPSSPSSSPPPSAPKSGASTLKPACLSHSSF